MAAEGTGGEGWLAALTLAFGMPGIGLGPILGLAGSAACTCSKTWAIRMVARRVFMVNYMLPDCIMRGPMRKMGSIAPVNTRAMIKTAVARVIKLITAVKSVM